MPRFARVIPDGARDRALDYLIPPAWEASVAPGSRVRVPLRTRTVPGTVVDVVEESEVASPKEIFQLMGEGVLIRPQLLEIAPGDSVYDPTCGSGGMLLSAAEELRRQGKEHRTLKLYGQERNLTTSAIATRLGFTDDRALRKAVHRWSGTTPTNLRTP